MTITATAPLTDAVTTRTAPPPAQSLLRHFLARALDTIVVGAATIGSTALILSAAGNSLPGADSWQATLIAALVIVTAVFLYGGLAGTFGTIGDAATGTRVIRISDGTRPGFLTGGLRAIGWVLSVALVLMLNDTGGAGFESRFVAVRCRPHTESA